jgi:hypothetical protein
MKKSLLILGFLGATTIAGAGARVGLSVAVGSTYAYGSMGDARRSSDTSQYIGCTMSGSSTSRYATCYARDAVGHYGSCWTDDENMLRVVETIGPNSSFSFSWSSSGCRSISITNDSRYGLVAP